MGSGLGWVAVSGLALSPEPGHNVKTLNYYPCHAAAAKVAFGKRLCAISKISFLPGVPARAFDAMAGLFQLVLPCPD